MGIDARLSEIGEEIQETMESYSCEYNGYSSLFLNGYSIYGLCITFWTNEFLGSYSNYKFIISCTMFSRMDLWGILCSQSNIEEVLSLSFSTSISHLWFCNSSSFLSSFSFF